jgi:hypothetical protein
MSVRAQDPDNVGSGDHDYGVLIFLDLSIGLAVNVARCDKHPKLAMSVDDQLLIPGVIAERDRAAGPFALAAEPAILSRPCETVSRWWCSSSRRSS